MADGESDSQIGWQAIRDRIMARIRAHTYPPGSLIPNEADLATEFGCARATVNRALQDLAATGFLDRRRKAGTRVVEAPRRKATLDIPLIRAEVEARGQRYDYRLLLREEAAAPADMARSLKLPQEARMLHVQSLHLADGVPRMFEDRWIALDTVPVIAAVDLSAHSANDWLVRHAPYTHGEMEFRSVAAGDVAPHLACDPATPILSMERVTWLDRAAITHVRQFFSADYRLKLDL